MENSEKRFLIFLIRNNIPYVHDPDDGDYIRVKEEDLLPYEIEIRRQFPDFLLIPEDRPQKEAGKDFL